MKMQKLYRFELAFAGEEQGVGFLQGLDDTPIAEPVRNELYEMFASLPVPPRLTTPDDSPVLCWFTEEGLAQFADAINAVIYELSTCDWQLVAMEHCINTDKPFSLTSNDALYTDTYQAVFSYSDFCETAYFDFREVSHVDPQSENPLIFIQKKNAFERGKFFIEVVQDMDGTYYANMVVAGTPVRGLPEHVDYNTLREAIRSQTGIEILKRRDMQFQQSGRKKYAYIDATQYRGEGKDCRVTLDEMRAGWEPDFTDSISSLLQDKKLSLDDQIKTAEAKYYSAPASIRRSAHDR